VKYEAFKAIVKAFERDYERELTLDEKVALASNSLRVIRAHWRSETGTEPPF